MLSRCSERLCLFTLKKPSNVNLPDGSPDSAWRALFRRDLQDALLAELDLRFHPIDALLAALRTP